MELSEGGDSDGRILTLWEMVSWDPRAEERPFKNRRRRALGQRRAGRERNGGGQRTGGRLKSIRGGK